MKDGGYGYIALHAAAAGSFFFILQRFAFNQSMETSLLWGGLLGIGAAVIAWMQTRR